MRRHTYAGPFAPVLSHSAGLSRHGMVARNQPRWAHPVATASEGDYVRCMRYLSTRDAGPAPALRSFEEVLLAGLAEDGGLYVPESLPVLGREALLDLRGQPYPEVAARIIALFAAGSFAPDELRALTERAYGAFGHAAVSPL